MLVAHPQFAWFSLRSRQPFLFQVPIPFVYTAFTDELNKHKAVFGDACVTIPRADKAEQCMQAVDRFQNDPEVRVAVCNIIPELLETKFRLIGAVEAEGIIGAH